MMAPEVKHHQQPIMLSPTTVVSRHTNDVSMCPMPMMVNGDMAKELRHLDRDRAAIGVRDDITNNKFSRKSVLPTWDPAASNLRQLGSPKTSSISDDSDIEVGPTYVSSQNVNLATLARPLRRRCQSTPVSGTNQRRTIFDSFWKKDDSASFTSAEADSDNMSATSGLSRSSARNGRGRAQSVSAVPDSPSYGSPSNRSRKQADNSESIDIMMFSPPVQHKSVLMSHFDGLEELPEDLQTALPALPSPLSRTYRNDGTHYYNGMYPLVSPRSILQKSTYGPEATEDAQSDDSPLPRDQSPSPRNGEFRKTTKGTIVMPLPLTLTSSIHLDTLRRSKDGPISNLLNDIESSDASSSTQSATGSRRRVHFDPRITVTEYNDEAPRRWYSDPELDQFKFESINLAQRYLRNHPELVADYCAGVVNPVTGVTKKKALYSLPILNDVSLDDEGADSDDATTARSNQTSSKPTFLYDYAKMANTHVQKILIVDPNKLILDLFCRSLRQIFPQAELTSVQTGDEALQRIKQLYKEASNNSAAARAFDIVIIEERLHALPLRGYGQSPRATQTKDRQPKSLSRAKHSSMTQLSDYNKVTTASDSLNPSLISGAEVMGRIRLLENEFCRPDRCILEEEGDGAGEESSQKDQESWRALMVGVCVDQKHDTLKLWQGGADLVWGKPPPPMGENLRNQLVSMLVRKRNPELLGGRR